MQPWPFLSLYPVAFRELQVSRYVTSRDKAEWKLIEFKYFVWLFGFSRIDFHCMSGALELLEFCNLLRNRLKSSKCIQLLMISPRGSNSIVKAVCNWSTAVLISSYQKYAVKNSIYSIYLNLRFTSTVARNVSTVVFKRFSRSFLQFSISCIVFKQSAPSSVMVSWENDCDA